MSSRRTFGVIPISCFCKSGKATALGRAFSGCWAAWASLGLPPRRQVGLELKGRRTGRPHTLAVVVAKYEGQHYLVSMLGECEWVKNARAQGEGYVISGPRHKVKLDEVPVERRAPIIKEYIHLAPGARPHIGLGTMASIAECQRVAPNHPVFQILYQDAPVRSHWSQRRGTFRTFVKAFKLELVSDVHRADDRSNRRCRVLTGSPSPSMTCDQSSRL